MDLSDLIDRNAAFTPDKAAIRFAGGVLTYADLARRIAATAGALKAGLGVGPGDRIAILAANHPDYLVLLYACARLGAMLVPVNWRLAVPEQLYILRDAGAKALLAASASPSRDIPDTIAGAKALPINGKTWQHGDDPQYRNAGSCLDQLHTILEQATIPAKLVDDDSNHACTLLHSDQIQRTDHLRKHAASIDIRNQNHTGICRLGHRPVGQVPIPQIQFGGAPGAFDDDDFKQGGESFVAFLHALSQL